MMMKRYSRWNRECDLQVIQLIYEGFAGDGIASRSGRSQTAIFQRLWHIGLSYKDARKAKRSGIPADQYLDTSPLYNMPEPVKPVQTALPLSDLELILDRLDSLNDQLVAVYKLIDKLKPMREAA